MGRPLCHFRAATVDRLINEGSDNRGFRRFPRALCAPGVAATRHRYRRPASQPRGDAEAHARTTVVQMSLVDAAGAFAAMGRPDLLIHLAWEGLPAYQNPRHIEVELPARLSSSAPVSWTV